MKQTALFLIVLLLASCAPAQPAAPTSTAIPATSTIPATATSVVVESTATALPPTATTAPTNVGWDYEIIPGSETIVDLDGYPVSIAVHPSMSSKFRDIEFSDSKVFADLMWEVEYSAWLGHKPEAEGKTLADFKDLVAKARAGDPQAMSDLTYVFPMNDMADKDGYEYHDVIMTPLIGGGRMNDGTLRPDMVKLLVVNTSSDTIKNISPKGQMGGGIGFSYMVENEKVIEVIYIAGTSEGLSSLEDLEWVVAVNLAVLPEMAEINSGRMKYPAGNSLTDIQIRMRDKLIGAMKLQK